MVARTSIASGLWSNPGTWDTGVPLASDAVVIAEPHTVTFDVDMTGLAAGVDLIINGALEASTIPGTYKLRSAINNIRGYGAFGVLRAGTRTTPYPSDCSFTIDHDGTARFVDLANLKIDLNCLEPTIGVDGIVFTSATSAGDTVLNVSPSVSGAWFPGQEVGIAYHGAYEIRTILSVGAGTITLTTGLAGAKAIGARLLLLTRNIRSIGATDRHFNSGSNGRIICEARGGGAGLYFGSGHTISGSAFTGCGFGVVYGSGHFISGSACNGCTYGVAYGGGHVISGGASNGCSYGPTYGTGYSLSGNAANACAIGVLYGYGHVVSGNACNGCDTGIHSGLIKMRNWSPAGNYADVAYLGYCMASGTALSGDSQERIVDSRRHAGVAGERRVWSPGGFAATDPIIKTAGFISSLKLTLQLSTVPCRVDDSIFIQAGQRAIFGGYLKLGAIVQAAHVRVQLIDPMNDPLRGGVFVSEFIPAATTEWQEVRLLITSDTDRELTLRCLGMAASGNLWWIPETAPKPIRISDTSVPGGWKATMVNRWNGSAWVAVG